MTENASNGPREIRPFSFGDDEENGLYDFRPRPVNPEVDDAPDPKVSSAPESAGSSFPPDLIPPDQTENDSAQGAPVAPVIAEKDSGQPKVPAPSTQTSSVATKAG